MDDMGTPVALVTGAAKGIGLEVARQLGAGGFRVILSARDGRAGPAVAALAEEGLDAHPLELDVTDPGSVAEGIAAVAREHGRLDVLVNNAAAAADWQGTATTADLDLARTQLETDALGAWRVTLAALPLLRRSRSPRVVNVASGAGSHTDPEFGLDARGGMAPGYGVAKAAMLAFSSALAAELRGEPVIVNSVCPGLTATAPGMEAMGARPVPEGAAGIVWAATLPDDGPRGGFFRDGAPLAW